MTLRIAAAIPFLILFAFTIENVSAIDRDVPSQTNIRSEKPVPASGLITGHVYAADTGAPLAKVAIVLIPVTRTSLNVTGEKRFAITDASGFYTFAQVAAGTYTVGTSPQGFISRYFDDVASPEDAHILSISAGETLERIDIRVIRAGVISGTVLDEENHPLQVSVQAVRLRYFRGGRRIETPRMSAFTDDLGNFRLSRLAPGTYYVRIETSNVNPQTGKMVDQIMFYPEAVAIENAQPLKVSAGNEISGIRFTVGMPESHAVSGNILDTSGAGGQRKFIIAIQRMNVGGSPRPSTTTSGGSFTITGVTPGEYLLTATAALPEQDSRSNDDQRELTGLAVIRVSDADTHAVIPVSSPADVSGRVITDKAPATPVSGIVVALWPQLPILENGPNGFNHLTDRTGAFKIQYFPTGNYDFSTFDSPGRYLKQVVCNGKDYTFPPLSIESGVSVNDCVLTMASDVGQVKGQVLDSEKPVPGLVVIAIPADRSLRHLERFTITGKTNANGEYQLTSVIPGDYLLFAVPPDDAETYFDIDFADRNQRDAEHVTVKSGDTKIVTLKPATSQ